MMGNISNDKGKSFLKKSNTQICTANSHLNHIYLGSPDKRTHYMMYQIQRNIPSVLTLTPPIRNFILRKKE